MSFLYFVAGLYFLGMVFIFLYSLAQGHLLFYFFKFKKKRNQVSHQVPNPWPKVTVQLPIYNERYVVERVIDAVAKLNYPQELLQIQILDDSTDETSALIQAKLLTYPNLNFEYLHRGDRKGFKAGALLEGLAIAQGEFVTIFDADFVPDPDFLIKTLPYFSSPKIGMVQSRWTHLNQNYSLFTQLQAFALDAHFLIEQQGRNQQGAFINFNGTAGIWRKSCILDAGNWQDDTLTEDLDLSYRAQRKGWKFIYRPEIESPAELPPILSAIKSQQFRWNKGGAECAVKHAGLVFREPHTWQIKFHAFAHLFNSTIFIAILLTSLCSIGLWWGINANLIPEKLFLAMGFSMVGFVLVAAVYLVSYLTAQAYSWRIFLDAIWKLPLFFSVSMGFSLHNSQAVLEGLSGKKSPFIRTPKFNLESGSASLQTNVYRLRSLPLITWLEGGMGLLFLGMVVMGIVYGQYLFLTYHGLLALGFSLVFISSLRTR
ncbi:MAG: glycosyltransferase family 2 protein [Bacteroidetes bacterium]|nr:glycosyltransferase family 2 protein [Bacteroidota bacterium]MDA1268044.1 glycosyltransferase family 2 protein [Bacteroidota bacterium]